MARRRYLSCSTALCTTALTIFGLGGSAFAATTIDRFLIIQPITVCNTNGTNCAAPVYYKDETEKIFLQANVLPVFLPTTTINNTNLQSVTGIAAINQVGNGQSSNANTINAWFTGSLAAPPGSVLYGEAWLGGNGLVVNSGAVSAFNGGVGRRDTFAHELGHNLGLSHTNFGAGGADNLLTAGSARTVPSGVGQITPDGADLSMLTAAQITQIRSSPFTQMAPTVSVDTRGSTPFNTNDFFAVLFADGPTGVSLTKLTLNIAPVGAFFDSTNDPPGSAGSPLQFSGLSGISLSDITVSGGSNGGTSLTFDFAPGTFVKGDGFNFGIDIDLSSAIDAFGATPAQLVGMTFDFVFDVGYAVQSELDADLITDSQSVTAILNTLSGSVFGPQVNPGDLPPIGTLDPPEPQEVPCVTSTGNDTCHVTTVTTNTILTNALAGTDTLRFGGDADFLFDVANIGTTYAQFELFIKADASNVTLTGIAGVAANWDIQAGTLTASTGNNIFNTSTVNVGGAGTFAVAASEALAR